MKKILLLVSSTVLLANSFLAQESDDDKKFRLGLKVAGQPTWFSSNEGSAAKLNTGFGFGFGLALEFRLSKTAYFVTGIGGDFENASIKYKLTKKIIVNTGARFSAYQINATFDTIIFPFPIKLE